MAPPTGSPNGLLAPPSFRETSPQASDGSQNDQAVIEIAPPLRAVMDEHTPKPCWAFYGAKGGSPRANTESTLKFHLVTYVRVQPPHPADPVDWHHNCTLVVRGIKWTLPPEYAVGLATSYKKGEHLPVDQVEVKLETWLTVDELQCFIAGGAAVEVPE